MKSTLHMISVLQHSEQEVEVILDKCIMLVRYLQDKVCTCKAFSNINGKSFG